MISERINESGKVIMFLTHTHTQTLPALAWISDSHIENGTVFQLLGVTTASLSQYCSPKQSCLRTKSWLRDKEILYTIFHKEFQKWKHFSHLCSTTPSWRSLQNCTRWICSFKTFLTEVIWKTWDAMLLKAAKKTWWKSITLQSRATCLKNTYSSGFCI